MTGHAPTPAHHPPTLRSSRRRRFLISSSRPPRSHPERVSPAWLARCDGSAHRPNETRVQAAIGVTVYAGVLKRESFLDTPNRGPLTGRNGHSPGHIRQNQGRVNGRPLLSNPCVGWCRSWDSNPDGAKHLGILSPVRLPVSPLRRRWAGTRLARSAFRFVMLLDVTTALVTFFFFSLTAFRGQLAKTKCTPLRRLSCAGRTSMLASTSQSFAKTLSTCVRPLRAMCEGRTHPSYIE